MATAESNTDWASKIADLEKRMDDQRSEMEYMKQENTKLKEELLRATAAAEKAKKKELGEAVKSKPKEEESAAQQEVAKINKKNTTELNKVLQKMAMAGSALAEHDTDTAKTVYGQMTEAVIDLATEQQGEKEEPNSDEMIGLGYRPIRAFGTRAADQEVMSYVKTASAIFKTNSNEPLTTEHALKLARGVYTYFAEKGEVLSEQAVKRVVCTCLPPDQSDQFLRYCQHLKIPEAWTTLIGARGSRLTSRVAIQKLQLSCKNINMTWKTAMDHLLALNADAHPNESDVEGYATESFREWLSHFLVAPHISTLFKPVPGCHTEWSALRSNCQEQEVFLEQQRMAALGQPGGAKAKVQTVAGAPVAQGPNPHLGNHNSGYHLNGNVQGGGGYGQGEGQHGGYNQGHGQHGGHSNGSGYGQQGGNFGPRGGHRGGYVGGPHGGGYRGGGGPRGNYGGNQGYNRYQDPNVSDSVGTEMRGKCFLCGVLQGARNGHNYKFCDVYPNEQLMRYVCHCGLGAHSFEACRNRERWPAHVRGNQRQHQGQGGNGGGQRQPPPAQH